MLGVLLVLLPTMLANVPYLNLLVLETDQRLVYLWVAALLIFRPTTNKIVLFILILLGLHFISLLLGQDIGSGVLGVVMYISLIYIFFKAFPLLKQSLQP